MTVKNQPQAEPNNTSQEPSPQLHPVDALRERRHITAAVFCGVCAQEGWRPGKSVTEAEFDAAVTRFMKGGGGYAARR